MIDTADTTDIYNREEKWNSRTASLIGNEGVAALASASVLVVGVGGVGGYTVEMLARSGVGHLTIVDADTVAESNLNRQLIAIRPAIGKSKVELFRDRIKNINPECLVTAMETFLEPESVEEIVGAGRFDMVIDAIDTVAPKVALIAWCMRNNIPVISSMGAGGRIDAAKVMMTDLWSTREDGLARAVRQRLKKMGLRRPLRVATSSEAPAGNALVKVDSRNKRTSYGTISTVPSMFGILLASEAICRLLTKCKRP